MKHSQFAIDILTAEGACPVSIDPASLGGMPAAAGAYVLLIETAIRMPVRLPQHGMVTFEPGTYLYVGSANGPGGIKARLKRHFKQNKKAHWHIDQLTTRAASVEALAVIGGNECMLGEMLLASKRYQVALPGFGSSDCRTCSSHLLQPVKKNHSA